MKFILFQFVMLGTTVAVLTRYEYRCAPCRIGHYKPVTAGANYRCSKCPRGTTTVAEGSTSEDDCG